MIADLLPLLAFAAVLVVARNVFEAYVLDHEQGRRETDERLRLRAQHGDGPRATRFRPR